MNRLSGLVLAACLLATAPFPTRAAITLMDDEQVVVPSHEVIEDDLIVWARYVQIDGLVKGDLVVFGTEIVVEGIVEQDLVAIGETVYLNGRVGDDATIGAYAVGLGERARVGDDIFELGYSLETKPGSAVGGTLYAATRQALLAGQVVEDVVVRAGALELRGLTGGDVRAVVGGLEGFTHSEWVIDLALEIPVVPEGIRLGPGATVGGDLLYRSEQPAVVDASARIDGHVRHEERLTGPAGPIALPDLGPSESRIGEAAERLAIVLGIGLLLAVAAPGWLRARSECVRDGPAASLGWGIGALLLGALASLVITVGGLSLLALAFSLGSVSLAGTSAVAGGLLQLAVFSLLGISLLYVAPVLASAAIGSGLRARFQPDFDDGKASIANALSCLFIGALVYTALRMLPGLGWLFALCSAWVGLGALALWLREVLGNESGQHSDG